MTFVRSTLVQMDIAGLHSDDWLSALSVLTEPARVGGGVFRDVYGVRGRPDVVLKIEARGVSFSNVAEWQVWQEVSASPHAKWFAPCVDISHDGRALLMKRTKPMPARLWNRLEVPAYFADLKQDNWGLLGGKPVCHDYALNLLISRGLRGSKRKPAVPNWAKEA